MYPAKFEVYVDAADLRSLEELMWSEGKALCRQESRSERTERMSLVEGKRYAKPKDIGSEEG